MHVRLIGQHLWLDI